MKTTQPLSSSEIGTLWLTFQEKTLILRFLEHFLNQSDDHEARNITGGLWQELDSFVTQIVDLFKEEQIPLPIGFTKEDINLEAPRLFDHGFDILFIRVLKEMSLGMYNINMDMTYRKDVIALYLSLTSASQRFYKLCTHYLIDKGIISLPPNVSMPKTTEFIQKTSYMNGLNPFVENRPLNDIEVGILHHGIEENVIGMQLIMGFAQVAEDRDVKNYFLEGKKLAQKQIKLFEEKLLESDVPFSMKSGGTVTTSTISPFSQKLMMYCIHLLNGFGTVAKSFGALFSFRNDLALEQASISKDIYKFDREGIKIMIKKGWFEAPPQMENRENSQ